MTVPEKEGDDIPLPEARLASSPPPPPPPPPAVSGTAVSGGSGCCMAKDCARAEEVSSADIGVSTDLRRGSYASGRLPLLPATEPSRHVLLRSAHGMVCFDLRASPAPNPPPGPPDGLKISCPTFSSRH